MQLITALLVGAIVSQALTLSYATDKNLRGRPQLHLSKTECTLFLKDTQYLPFEETKDETDLLRSHVEEKWSCEFDPVQAKNLGIDIVEIEGIDRKFLESQGAKSGFSTMIVSESIIEGTEKMIVPSTAFVEVAELLDGYNMDRMRERRRKLAAAFGALQTLVVRVVANDGTEPTPSINQIRADVFEDKLCLKSQYEACSYGQLKIEPFHGKTRSGRQIIGGVVDVKINSNPKIGNKQTFEANAKAKAAELYGDLTQFDLVMFCMPPGTGDWLAYAYINRWDSFYNDKWCSSVSTQVHEVGHNIGLAHSGEGSLTYGDQSGMMGYSYNADDAPKMCFNPAKNYQLGWYKEQVKSINPLTDILAKNNNNSQNFIINGVADYQFGKNGFSNNLISLQLKQENSEDDYYIGFNRKTKMNSGTVEDPNQVVVIKKIGPSNQVGQSWKVSRLSSKDSYTIENFDKSSFNVTIQLSSLVRKDAKVKISVTNAVTCSKVKDRDLQIRNKKNKNCDWVSENKRFRCSRKWKNELLSEWCQRTCGSC